MHTFTSWHKFYRNYDMTTTSTQACGNFEAVYGYDKPEENKR
jgi:hypothetical protein